VEAVVTAQVQEAPIPDHFVALATRDDRAQVVVDALAGHPAQPLQRAQCPSRNDSSVISSEKKAVCAPEYGSDATSA
jgi:hypothetical protein